MRTWIIALLLVGTASSLILGQDVGGDDDEYEVKRFHIESRQLNGPRHCVVSRRRRSTTGGSQESRGNDENSGEADGPETDPEMEMGVSTAEGTQESEGLVLQDTDLAGNAGILVIQNGQSSTPLLFQIRPVTEKLAEPFFQIEDGNNPELEPEDDQDDQDDQDVSDEREVDDNRYRPSRDQDSAESEEEVMPVRRVRPTKKPKRKPSNQSVANKKQKKRRPSSQGSKRKPNRKNSKNKNRNKNKNQNKSKKRNKKRRNSSNKRKQPFSTYLNEGNNNKRLGVTINKGSGMKTVTRTITTTHTGTANDAEDVNCIIINKSNSPAPAPAVERPFWDILGRSTGQRGSDRSFGLRKRINFRRLA